MRSRPARDAFDAVVVGAGPAGAIAALALARGGASVLLVDRERFPRDKACGDLVGPRGLSLLADLGVDLPSHQRVTEMGLVGPSRRAIVLPWREGSTYPGHAALLPRLVLDHALRSAAAARGVSTRRAHVVGLREGGRGVALADGTAIEAAFVIGADGALSRVAAAAGLVEPRNTLWGFALRSYLDADVARPTVYLWEPTPWRAFAGYGWLFPAGDGRANVGLGLGVGVERGHAARAPKLLHAFVDDLRRTRAVPSASRLEHVRGAWLKLAARGTRPAAGRTLLVGDAAGLVNPYQGEGIAEAMDSGRAAAAAILDEPSAAAPTYERALRERYAGFHAAGARLHMLAVGAPRFVSVAGRLLTARGASRAWAGAWSIYWNDLLDGATPGWSRSVAFAIDLVARRV